LKREVLLGSMGVLLGAALLLVPGILRLPGGEHQVLGGEKDGTLAGGPFASGERTPVRATMQQGLTGLSLLIAVGLLASAGVFYVARRRISR